MVCAGLFIEDIVSKICKTIALVKLEGAKKETKEGNTLKENPLDDINPPRIVPKKG